MVEDHESAERAAFLRRFKKRINHRQPVTEHVSQCHRQQVLTAAGDAATSSAPTVLDNPGLDVAVLHHHGVVEHGHVGHPAMAMAMVEIGAEYGILLGGRHRTALFAYDVGVARQDLSQIARWP